MKMKSITGALVALSLGATPALAAPAGAGKAAAANPASSLSIASGARVGSKSGKSSKLSGGTGILAAILLAGIIAIPVIDAVSNNDDNNNPTSP